MAMDIVVVIIMIVYMFMLNAKYHHRSGNKKIWIGAHVNNWLEFVFFKSNIHGICLYIYIYRITEWNTTRNRVTSERQFEY